MVIKFVIALFTGVLIGHLSTKNKVKERNHIVFDTVVVDSSFVKH